jgi:hypothetical protein
METNESEEFLSDVDLKVSYVHIAQYLGSGCDPDPGRPNLSSPKKGGGGWDLFGEPDRSLYRFKKTNDGFMINKE